MTDLFLELSRNPGTRRVIRALKLPVPLPSPLERTAEPYAELPLEGRELAFAAAPGAAAGGKCAELLSAAGARVLGPESATAPWALVFDATGISRVDDLRALYDFFHPLLAKTSRLGRALVIGRSPVDAPADAEDAAAQAALEGFTRSLGREVGRKGATANLLRVEEGAESLAAGPLRFLLSPRSAFVTGQPLQVSARGGNGYLHSAAKRWTRPLDAKVALVTGAARGIGEATARALAREGARVVCLDLPADEELAARVAREIGGTHLLADVADPRAPERIARELLEKHGGVDVVVHNAGVTRDKTLLKMSPELWDQALAVNLRAAIRVTEALLGGALRDGGRLLFLSSIAGIAGNMGQTNYSAAKAGVIGFVRALAPQLAPRGITVNAVAPGFIETRLTAAIPVMIREMGRRMSALGQGGQPADVAEALVFLSTPGAQGLGGQVLRVCGGALVGA